MNTDLLLDPYEQTYHLCKRLLQSFFINYYLLTQINAYVCLYHRGIFGKFCACAGAQIFLLGVQVVPLAEICMSQQNKSRGIHIILKIFCLRLGTHIFARGTSCAPSRNMGVPPKKSTSQNEGHTYFCQGHKLCPQQKYVCPTKKKYFLE